MDAPTEAAISLRTRASTIAPTRGERPDAARWGIRRRLTGPSLIFSPAPPQPSYLPPPDSLVQNKMRVARVRGVKRKRVMTLQDRSRK